MAAERLRVNRVPGQPTDLSPHDATVLAFASAPLQSNCKGTMDYCFSHGAVRCSVMQRRTDFRNIEDGQARRPRPAQLDARAGGWRVVELWRRRGTGTLPVRCEVYVAVSGRHGLYLEFGGMILYS